jgi:hypothetical protein
VWSYYDLADSLEKWILPYNISDEECEDIFFQRAIPSERGWEVARTYAHNAVNELRNEHDNFIRSNRDIDEVFAVYHDANGKSANRAGEALARTFVLLLTQRGLIRVG